MVRRFHPGLAVLAVLVQCAACGDGDNLVGQPLPNAHPDTSISGTPPTPLQTNFQASFFWTGSDLDGDVVGFEWRISENGPDGIVDIGDTLHLPWSYTEGTDSTFFVSANLDSFDVDVENPELSPFDYRHWQTHTFFVRAVDDDGARDPSPAHLSFTATTMAPRIFITAPAFVHSITCRTGPQVLRFGWIGFDPDGDPPVPTHTRYILLPLRTGHDESCITQTEFERKQFIFDSDPLWSDWIAYDASNDSGRTVTLPRQELGGRFLFAVQARDVAGSVTPTFEWGFNVRHIRVQAGNYPLLRVSENFLGQTNGIGPNGFKTFEIVSGQPLTFTWQGNADHYAGLIDAYRYGWNLVDMEDPLDPGWAIQWSDGPSALRSSTRSFQQGSPNFVVQCRDNSGTISRLVYQFQVIQITDRAKQRNLLFVTDFPMGDGAEQRNIKTAWQRQWNDMVRSQVVGFQARDMVDAEFESSRINFPMMNEYKSVIWFTSPAERTFFHSRLAPQAGVEHYNWVESYQAQVGNFLLCGPGGAQNSVERGPPPWILPMIFNTPANPPLGLGVTTWPDGTKINVGTMRWPYSAWCLEASDVVRPPTGAIFGELGGYIRRSTSCDALHRALVPDSFYSTYPEAVGLVRDLQPSESRTAMAPEVKLPFEEFYNANTTTRPVSINLRPCQTPMFLHRARRDDGLVESPESTCLPPQRASSTLEGAAVGIVSSIYSESKQLRGSEDVLWGFHPLAFDTADVKDALRWVFESRWQLPVNR